MSLYKSDRWLLRIFPEGCKSGTASWAVEKTQPDRCVQNQTVSSKQHATPEVRSCPQASYRILHSWGFDLAFFIHVFHVKLEYSYKYKMLQALVTDTQVWNVWQVNAAPLLLRWQRGDRDIDATEELLVTKLNIQSVGIGGLHISLSYLSW